MPFRVPPDVEAIAIQFLIDNGVTYERVYATIPADPVFPLLTVNLAPSQIVVERLPLLGGALDVMSWADTKASARDELAVAVAVLTDPSFRGVHQFGVVTGAAERVGMQSIPDPDTGRERYLSQITVYAHPLPS